MYKSDGEIDVTATTESSANNRGPSNASHLAASPKPLALPKNPTPLQELLHLTFPFDAKCHHPAHQHLPISKMTLPEASGEAAASSMLPNIQNLVSIRDLTEHPLKFFAFFEHPPTNDAAALIKWTVHLAFFGAAILNLGTEWHHRTFLPLIESASCLGCFAMTEKGHGKRSQMPPTHTAQPHTITAFSLLINVWLRALK